MKQNVYGSFLPLKKRTAYICLKARRTKQTRHTGSEKGKKEMKRKIIHFLSALLLIFPGFQEEVLGASVRNPVSDSVPYKAVLIEDFLGTWCNNCPRVTDTIDRILDDYPAVRVIGYHTNESRSDVRFLYNMDTWERSCYYDTIRSVPAVYVNGKKIPETARIRSTVADQLQRKTPYSLELESRHFPLRELSRDSFQIRATVRRVAKDTDRDLRLHLSFIQDHLPFAWYNQTEINHANTFMYPDGKGSKVALDGKQEAVFDFSFSLSYQESRLLMNNAHLIAFLQDERIIRYDTLYNGTLLPVKDNTVLQVAETDFSQGDFSYGLQDIFSPDFHVWQTELADGESVQFHNNTFGENLELTWTFDGGQPEISDQPHPTVKYENPGTYSVSLQAEKEGIALTRTRQDLISVLDVKPKFTIEPNPAKPNQKIHLEVVSEADSCEWRFFGGSPFLCYGKTAEVKFPLEGLFNIQLKTFYKSPETGILYAYDSTSAQFVEIRQDADNESIKADKRQETIRILRIPATEASYEIFSPFPLEYAEAYGTDGVRILHTNMNIIDLGNYPEGIYIILVKIEGEMPVSKKIIR